MASSPKSQQDAATGHFDCSALLAHVHGAEMKLLQHRQSALLQEDEWTDFGHPLPPQLSMFRLDVSGRSVIDQYAGHDNSNGIVVLMIAYTKHCISVQILTPQNNDSTTATTSPKNVNHHAVSSKPPLAAALTDALEHISCVTLVALADLSLVVAHKNDDEPMPRIAVVFGTTLSRVCSVEFKVRVSVGHGGQHQFELMTLSQESDNHKSNLDNDNFDSKLRPPLYFQPLPLDPATQHRTIRDQQRVPFCPTGGVTHLSTFAITVNRSKQQQHLSDLANKKTETPLVSPSVAQVWIAYADGTILRVHHAAFFPSVVPGIASLDHENNDSNATAPPRSKTCSLYKRLAQQQRLLLRCQAKIAAKDASSLAIVPLPKYHPSPLAPLPPFQPSQGNDSSSSSNPNLGEGDSAPPPPCVLSDQDDDQEADEDEGKNDDENGLPEVCEALLYVHPRGTAAEGFPTLCFYTSEDQFVGRIQGHGGLLHSGSSAGDTGMGFGAKISETPILGSVVGGTKAVVGGILGAVAWGFGGRSVVEEPKPGVGEDDNRQHRDADGNTVEPNHRRDANYFFPTIRNNRIISLFAGYEVHDAPRQVESCTVDPEGDLAATTDSFGRVLLIDLSTKSIIRLFKGFREASCHWLQVPRRYSTSPSVTTQKKFSLYLVIHSRQRRVVEVYRVRHGPRVKLIQVGRDAQVVSCQEWSPGPVGGEFLSSCYLVHSCVPGGALPTQIVEKIVVQEAGSSFAGSADSRATHNVPTATSPKEAALRLQRLQQLLANTNVPCQLQDVHNALLQIKSLKDLATSLDRLSVASVLESKMGVKGTEFQKTALTYCRETLKDAVKKSKGDPANNPHVKVLATKIVYHTQVINAFDILHKFEMGEQGEEDQQVAPRSSWIEEAMGWISTYERIHGKREEDIANEAASLSPLNFSAFANACVPPPKPDSATARGNRKIEIYFSDSSKTRREVITHVFKPLLGDIFAFNVVDSIFESLGIKDDADYLLKCFGEWYMTLSTKEAVQIGFYSLYSPMTRWLQERVTKELDRKNADKSEIALKALHAFCAESDDLVKAFMLGALCREAVAKASIKKEEKTYGKISSSQKVMKWDVLLRKLRVCLLVTLRLKDIRIGTFPITVNHVDKNDIFSIYEWLAHDELAMSHNHEEITKLEEMCKISALSFDPSLEAGDAKARFVTLQNACLSAALSEEEKSEYLVDFDDDDKLGALLLFFRSHNEPALLVAHRALLLSSMWSQEPHAIEILGDALVALQSLWVRDDYKALAAAVRLEVWQTRIRPIYRALLFGFHDVQEVSEHIVAPLFHQPEWVKEFGRLALEILNLLLQIPWKDSMNKFEAKLEAARDDNSWPFVRPDFMLDRFVQRAREVNRTALDMHRVIVCALRVADDIQILVNCVPSFHECFEPHALFQPVAQPQVGDQEQQRTFLDNAIISHAQRYSGPVLDTFGLGEIETLGSIWNVDMKNIRTTFFLAMYEFGKDRLVDELLTKSSSSMNVVRLVECGVDVVCRRLNDLLHVRRRKFPALREAMGLLDADLCVWLRERAEKSKSLVVFPNLQVPVGNTHLFTMRLLSLSRLGDVDKETRVRIHPLMVLSGQLVKVMESSR